MVTRPRTGTVLTAFGLVAVLAVTFAGPRLAPRDPAAPGGIPWTLPGPGSAWGTDVLGRDVASRVLAGGTGLLGVAIPTGLAATVAGTALGLLAAWAPRPGRTVQAVSAGMLAVPGMLVVLVSAVAFPAWLAVLVGMLVLGVPLTARVVQTAAAPRRAAGFIEAAQLRGEPAAAVLTRELLPAVAGTVLADAGLRVVVALQLTVAVHVLGFGPPPGTANWALMIRENLPGIVLNPWSVLAPAAAIMIVAVSLTVGIDVLAGRLVPDPGTGSTKAPAGTRRWCRPTRPATATGHPQCPPDQPAVVSLRDVVVTDGEFRLACPALDVRAGEVLGIVGVSGSGKSTLLHLLLGEVRAGLRLTGVVRYGGRALVPGSAAARRWRRRAIALLGQDPAATLDPLRRVGSLVGEADPRRRRDAAREVLDRLGLPVDVARRRPHTLSGGQAGRVALARAVVGELPLLLADEPTSGLDQATVELVRSEIDRRRRDGLSSVLVSHDRAWVTEIADRVLEVAGGTVRPAATVVAAAPRRAMRALGDAVLRLERLAVAHPPGAVPLLAGADLAMYAGELVVLVGPSGCGKSTLLRAVCGLHPVAAGSVRLRTRSGWRRFPDPDTRDRDTRRALALLGQDPAGELNPAHRILDAVARPRRVLLGEPAGTARAHAATLLDAVGLDARSFAGRRPAACSGGQRQRASLARALAAEPALLLADEPTSALDAVTAHAVLDLLNHHRHRDGLAVLLVTHDREVAARADRVLEIDCGQLRPVRRPRGCASREPAPGGSRSPRSGPGG